MIDSQRLLLNKEKRIKRSRKQNQGTDLKPRMVVFRSNKYIYGQLLDDRHELVILGVSEKNITADTSKMTKTVKAKSLGEIMGKLAIKKGIKEIIFDRRGYQYHGRVKAFADGAREAGLIF